MPADDAVLRTLIGPPLGESFRTLGVAPERVDHAVEVYRRHYAEGGVTQAVLYDGIAELLHSLHRRGVRLGVATAKRVDFARLMLERLGVADLFDAIAGASLDLRITAKYDIMASVLDHWGDPDPKGVWMVGDRHYDMVAARAHEVTAVGALWGFGSERELTEAGAHWLATRPLDLLDDELLDVGSPVCLVEEVCDVSGRVLDAVHPTSSPGPTPVA